MVKFLVLFTSLSLCLSSVADEEITAETLINILKEKDENRQAEIDRIRASSFDRTSLKLLSNQPIDFILPNGETVLGMMLPTGKKSPAVSIRGHLYPACVTTSYTLIKGNWNDKTKGIDCVIEASELAYIDTPQVGLDGDTPKAVTSNKYGGASQGDNPEKETVITETIYRVLGDNTPGQINDSAHLSGSTSGAENAHRDDTDTNTESKSPGQKVRPKNPYIYTLPTNVSTRNTDSGGSVKSDKSKFGIRRGTWARAKIERQVTNTESGDIEIVLAESIVGDYRTLPEGTILFANKTFNSANRRLEAATKMGVLPTGEEIDGINAYIYSMNKTAGLHGLIERDIDGELKSAGSNAALNVAKSLLPSGAVVVDAVKDVSSEMLDNQRDAGPIKPEAIIRVDPQEVYIKIAKSF